MAMHPAAPRGRSDLASESALSRAAALLQAGRWGEAEALCRQVLASNPERVEALNILGLCVLQRGDVEQAIERLQGAVRLAPDNFGALANLGSALQAAGRYGEALTAIERAAVMNPANADIAYNRGNVLRSLGREEDAVAAYGRALTLRPDHVGALGNRGNALRELGRREEALRDFEAAIVLIPHDARARYNRAVVLQELKRAPEAVAEYERALMLQPDYAEAHLNLGLGFKELKRSDAALACFDRALELRADFPEARTARGNLLLELERFEDLLENIDQALALHPTSAEGHSFRGDVLRKLGRDAEAIAAYERALSLSAGLVKTLINRGATLLDRNEVARALADFCRASSLYPDNSLAHWNEALCLLLLGDFAAGWPKFEWRVQRWREHGVLKELFHDDSPAWLGETEVRGRTLLLHAEQGLGDTLQFCRYAPLLADRGARVILEVQAPLVSLLNGLRGINRVVPMNSPAVAFDLHTPLMSLPLALGTTLASIPGDVPYLRADPTLATAWLERLGPRTSRPRIGIAWRGSPDHVKDRFRSLALTQLSPLARLDIELIGLQKDVPAAECADVEHLGICNFGEALLDFADTAALLDSVDLVVSADTAVAHLAGAMGKPVWIFIPFAPDWRWMLDRTDSPWYPTARLFRNSTHGDWSAAVADVVAALRGLFPNLGERQVTGVP
ncbi:putative TPR repeat protein [Burkholderiales bacterium]|nr:putative TPR repeat protein [Burkholderiales bacterium]